MWLSSFSAKFRSRNTKCIRVGLEIPIMAQWELIQLVSVRIWVRSLAPLSGLRIWRCHELWYRSQMQLRSRIAVAVAQAGSCSSYTAPILETSICHGCGPRKQKKKKTRVASLDDPYSVFLPKFQPLFTIYIVKLAPIVFGVGNFQDPFQNPVLVQWYPSDIQGQKAILELFFKKLC